MNKSSQEHYIGCLLGGAVGDALGAPTEFMSLDDILQQYGQDGVAEYVEYHDQIGRFTDDTQMTLFTAEGLLRSMNRAVKKGIGGAYLKIVHESYLRWLHTQDGYFGRLPAGQHVYDGWLLEQELLYKRRAPGMTCMGSLRSGKSGSIDQPINHSKGCGGVMRMAPVGLLFPDPEEAFKIGAELAALTHGHPCGYLSAGALAAIIAFINQGRALDKAIAETLGILGKWDHHAETTQAIHKAIDLFEKKQPSFKNLESLGGGWVGEEALAMALYCALSYPDDFEKAIVLSINHSGDTDSTGAIAGNILGLSLGQSAIPQRWQDHLELAGLVREVAEDLHTGHRGNSDDWDEEWDRKYPGH